MSIETTISTISCNGKIGFTIDDDNLKLDLKSILAYLKFDDIIIGMKLYDVSDSSNKCVYSFGFSPKKGKGLKNHISFYIIPRTRKNGKTVFFRIAANGKFQIHGIKTLDEIEEVAHIMVEKLNKFNKEYNIFDEPYSIDDDYKKINLRLELCKIMNLNVKIEFPFQLNRATLSNIIDTRYKTLVSYENDTPSVRIPYYEGKTPIAVLLVYRCGKVTITGVKSWNDIERTIKWFTDIVYKYRQEIELKEWEDDIPNEDEIEEKNKEDFVELLGGKELTALNDDIDIDELVRNALESESF